MTDNELIAEFMGWEKGRYWNLPNKLHKGEGIFEIGIYNSDLRYDASWDWLMPVVEKIHSMDIQVEISITRCVIHGNDNRKMIDQNWTKVTPLIECVYKAVVEFIKWYNENKKSALSENVH